MKKIFSLFVMLVFSMTTLFAQVVDSTDVVTDTVQIVMADEVEPGVLNVVWFNDSTASEAYSLYIEQFDTVNYVLHTIAGVASFASSFAIAGYDGFFQCTSDLILYYGSNYASIEQQGAPSDIVDEWRTAWETCVKQDYTLNPGVYVMFVEGIDLEYNTTEVEAYVVVMVAETADGIEDISVQNIKSKFINNGQMYILKDNKIYDIYGNVVK